MCVSMIGFHAHLMLSTQLSLGTVIKVITTVTHTATCICSYIW